MSKKVMAKGALLLAAYILFSRIKWLFIYILGPMGHSIITITI
jgi:hypothetical protein